MSRYWKYGLVAVGALLVLALAGLLFVGNYFFSFALDAQAETSYMDPDWAPEGDPWLEEVGTHITREAPDGVTLHAWQIPREGSRRYVIICHGYGNSAAGMSGAARHFYELGYSVLLPDARAHGESEGRYIGMGWPERRDVVDWAQLLVDQDPQAQIALYGVSMGGATVMMASGEADLPKQVLCVVEDCGYSSAWDELAYQLDALYGLPPFPILNTASLVSRVRAGYWLGEASAAKQVAKSTTPTLFIHGDADTFVPFFMLDVVYEAAACEKERLVVPGAAHAEARTTNPDLYWGAVDAFLARYIDEGAG